MPPRGNPFARGTPPAPEFNIQARLDVPAAMREVDLPDGGAKALNTLSDRLDSLSADLIQRNTEAVRQNAFEAGFTDGAENPAARMEGGGRVYRDAYNRAATEGGVRRLEVSGREALDRLAREHATNPTAFGEAAQAWRDGAAADLPPLTKSRFLLQYDGIARSYLNHVQQQSDVFVRDQDLATFNGAMETRQAARDRAALAATTDPKAADDLRREDANFLNDLIGRGPKEAFTLDGKQYPADPTRTGAIRLPEMERLWSKWTRAGRSAMVLGDYRASPDPEAYIRDFEARHLGPRASASPADPAGRARYVYDQAIAQGYSPEAAAGITANVQHESGFNPSASHDGGKGVGILGWNGPRRAALEARFGKTPTFEQQVEFLLSELAPGGPEATAGDRLRSPNISARDAGADYSSIGVRPRDVEGNRAARAASAAQYQAQFSGSGGSAGSGESGGLPIHEALEISRLLRSDLAHRRGEQREAQHSARVRLDPLHTANIEAAKVGAPPINDITDDEYRAAGYDPAKKRQDLASQQHLYTAGQELAGATSPERAQEIAERFAPGTELFMADPKAAGAILNAARERGAQIAGAAVEARIADLAAQAEASGKATMLPEAEGRAAGLRPEKIAKINEELALKADYARRFQEALRLPPAEQAAAVAQLRVEGTRAAENKILLQAYAKAAEAQSKGLAEDPAGFVMGLSKPAQELWSRAGKDPEAMGALINLLEWEQTRLGVPEHARRPLPKAVAKQFVAELEAMSNEPDRLRRLSGFLATVQDETHRSRIMAQLAGAGLKEHLAVGAIIAQRGGEALGARIAGELAVKADQLGLDGTTKRTVLGNALSAWDQDDRLGGLRRAQAAAAPGAGFTQAGEHEQRLFEKVALVRQGGTGTHNAREIYTQMFGGRVIVNRPDDGVLVSAPAGQNADQVATGLTALRHQRLAEVATTPQQLRDMERVGVWVDHGAGRYALYARGMPAPMAGVDGQPIVATLEDVLIAESNQPSAAQQREAQRRQLREMRARQGERLRQQQRDLGGPTPEPDEP